jgi:hypothetical protein
VGGNGGGNTTNELNRPEGLTAVIIVCNNLNWRRIDELVSTVLLFCFPLNKNKQ